MSRTDGARLAWPWKRSGETRAERYVYSLHKVAEILANGRPKAADGRWVIDENGIAAFDGRSESSFIRIMIVTWDIIGESSGLPMDSLSDCLPDPVNFDDTRLRMRVRYLSRGNTHPVDGGRSSEGMTAEEQERHMNSAFKKRAVIRRQWQALYKHVPGQEGIGEMQLFSYNGDLHRHRQLPIYFVDVQQSRSVAYNGFLSLRLDARVPWRHISSNNLPGPFLELLHRSYFLSRYAEAPLMAFALNDGELVAENSAAIEHFGRIVPIQEQNEDTYEHSFRDAVQDKRESRDFLKRFFLSAREVRVANTDSSATPASMKSCHSSGLQSLPGLGNRARICSEQAYATVIAQEAWEGVMLCDRQCFMTWPLGQPPNYCSPSEDVFPQPEAVMQGDRWRWFKVTTRQGVDPVDGQALVFLTCQDVHLEERAVSIAEVMQLKAKKLRDNLLNELLPPPVARELLAELGNSQHMTSLQRRWNLLMPMSTQRSLDNEEDEECETKTTTPSSTDRSERIGRVTARRHDAVAICFSDIVGYTALTASVGNPEAIMRMLDELYTAFDEICDLHAMYKVETVGDAYVAAAGLFPDSETFYAESRECTSDSSGSRQKELVVIRTLRFACDIVRRSALIKRPDGKPLLLRVGVHIGSVTSGIVGRKMPRFCLFGDAMNFASRMESTGLPRHIQVTRDLFDIVKQMHRGLPFDEVDDASVPWPTPGSRVHETDADWMWRKRKEGVYAKGKGIVESYLLVPRWSCELVGDICDLEAQYEVI